MIDQPTTRTNPWPDRLWLVLVASLSSLLSVSGASRLSATFDEPVYLERGLHFWRTGSHLPLLRSGTMPLPPDVQTLPLYIWERWRGEAFEFPRDIAICLPVARAGTLVFWWILLIYGFRLASSLGGPWAGRLAVALMAFEPSMMTHAGLATTDIAVASCVVALVYHYRAGREDPAAGWRRRVGWPMIWYAAAILAKASGLVFGIFCFAVMEWERLYRIGALKPPPGTGWLRNSWRQFVPYRRDLRWIMFGGLALTFIYCGCDWQADPSFIKEAKKLPEGPLRDASVWVAEHLKIFGNAGQGIGYQIQHNFRGHGSYLLGVESPRYLRYYFFVVTSIKLTVPLLLAPIMVTLVRPRLLLNGVLISVAVLMVYSVTFRVQIGIRMIFPIVALFITGIAPALVSAARSADRIRGLATAGYAVIAVAWAVAATLAVWPHGISYVNALWGGTTDGYKLVSEANYDWGQGLLELRGWAQTHQVESLPVWYFGTDPRVRERPLELLKSPESDGEIPALVKGRFLAVSTTLIYGPPSSFPSLDRLKSFIRERQPVDRTTTFLIYDFTHGVEPNTSSNSSPSTKPAVPGS